MDAIAQAIKTATESLPNIKCDIDEPMQNHTSFKIGGPVRAMFFPRSAEELMELREILGRYGLEPLIIGNGTNLLVVDAPLELTVIKTTGMCGLSQTGDVEITADAGISLAEIAAFACDHGLTGFEFAHGIPGTVGGAVMMNAGAYDREIKDVVFATKALSRDNSIHTFHGVEHNFAYRRSRFTGTGDILLSSVLRLQESDKNSIRARMDELETRRQKSQPLDVPSAGSTFKRPKEGYAAELIEKAGLKGLTIGGAQVSEKHSGFVVNRGSATFYDIMAIIEQVQETVLNEFNIRLEPEVMIVSR